jgi:NTE family protein
MSKIINELILSGGGMSGIAMLGTLHEMYNQNLLNHVNRIIGTSIGGVIGFLINMGYTPQIIFEIITELDFNIFREINCDRIMMFYDTLGFADGTTIMKIIRILQKHKKIDDSITFKQLYEITNVELLITGYNLNKSNTDCFNYIDNPDMSVLLAIRITISIPLYFKPVKYNNSLYVDGGTVEPIPIRFCKRRSHSFIISLSKNKNTTDTNIEMPEYVNLLFGGVYKSLSNTCLEFQKKYPMNIFILKVVGGSLLNFNLTKNNKQNIYDQGVDAFIKWNKIYQFPTDSSKTVYQSKK